MEIYEGLERRTFEALSTVEPRAEVVPVSPDPLQATEARPLAAPPIEHGGVASVADSDAEGDHPESARHDSEDEEPLAPKPKRKHKCNRGRML